MAIDLRGLVPAPVTPFTRDGDVDVDAIHRLGSWLGSFDGVKSLVVLGHAGEGTFLHRRTSRSGDRGVRRGRQRTASRSSPASPARAPRSRSRRPSGPSTPGAQPA